MGSLFTPKQAPVPPTPPPSTYRDEVNGVEQVPVVQPDGTTVYVTRSIPLTTEQQARKDQLNSIMDEALAEMKRLSGGDYSADEGTKAVMAEWEKVQGEQLEKLKVQRTEDEEAALAKRGLSDSSMGQEVRRQRRLDEQEAKASISSSKDALGADIRSQQYSLQQSLYNIAASATDADKTREAAAAVRSQASAVAQDTARQASLLDYYNRQNSTALGGNYSLFGKVLGTVASPVTSVGSSLGSWLWRR